MAFNWPTFRTRALTAIVFVAVMLVGLLWNQWSFLLLFSVIHFGCWWEYLRLIEKIYTTAFHIYTKFGLMLIGYGIMIWCCGPEYQLDGYTIQSNFSLPVTVAGFVLTAAGIFQKIAVHAKPFAAACLGAFYISLSWGLMLRFYSPMTVRFHDTLFVVEGYAVPVLIIASIWINDTMAYIVGSFIGKTPLSPISPKKTWEGTIGGIILAVVVTSLLARWIPGLASWTITGAIALIAAITGTAGDLLESKLKRMAGVKDSGHIMPGHGGFMDRFDSLLVATPCVGIFLLILRLTGN